MGSCQVLEIEKNGELVFNGYRISVWENVKALEIDDDDNSTTMWMYLMSLNWALKMAVMVGFMLCIFYCNKKCIKGIRE